MGAWWYRQRLQADVRKHIEYLTCGFLGSDFYVIPKRINCLFESFKSYGFISDKTDLSDFVVVFGFPYSRKLKDNGVSSDFKPVQWMKNAQLYRCFLSSVFSEDVLRFCGAVVSEALFVDRRGFEMQWPRVDKQRLAYSADYGVLCKLLKEYQEMQ